MMRSILMTALASVIFTAAVASASAADWATPIAKVNQDRSACPRLHTKADFRGFARGVFRRAHIGRYAVHRVKLKLHCQRTLANERKMRALRDGLKFKRKHVWVWEVRFHRLSGEDQLWANRISHCESSDRQIARESGFLSYFQWVYSTWIAAGGVGNPEDASWYHQAVLAVRWMHQHGTMHWPDCSKKLGYA